MSFLYDHQGKRKYLTVKERNAFLSAAKKLDPETYTFCATLAYSGARISEVLALAPGQIDYDAGIIIIECLKKRREGIYRAVPVPVSLLKEIQNILQMRRQNYLSAKRERIWPWCRTTAWKQVKKAMSLSGIVGLHASPKGLRHGFAVGAIQSQLPLNLVRKWLGHSRISTTAIYADAIGEEERSIAARFWETFI